MKSTASLILLFVFDVTVLSVVVRDGMPVDVSLALVKSRNCSG